MAIKSILDSVKKSLGLDADNTDFDQDVILQINSALSTLGQLGVGPVYGLSIEDSSTTWDDLLFGDARYDMVKNFVYYETRLGFDPPGAANLVTAYQEKLKELTFRISVLRENDRRPVPAGTYSPSGGALDGGSPFDNQDSTNDIFDGGSP